MVDVFHIGYHKTGTTFLQREFFGKHPNIYLRKTGRILCEKEFNLLKYKEYNPLIKSDDMTIVESYEGLSGDHTGIGNAFKYIDRIKSINSKAKIVICIRDKEDFKRSIYKQQINEGKFYSYRKFISVYAETLETKLKYDLLVSKYINCFGLESVRVFSYEHLLKDVHGFIHDLSSFIGVPYLPCYSLVKVNPSLTGIRLKTLVFINIIFAILKYSQIPSSFLEKLRHRLFRRTLQWMESRVNKI